MIITINVLAIPLVILFVRPSVKVQYCVQTAKHVVNVFSPPDSPIILFFQIRSLLRKSDGKPASKT